MPKQAIKKQEDQKQVISLSSGQQLELTCTLVMGVLNVTPDSFSDRGQFVSIPDAVKRALMMEEEGADIIDIGGESTRPGAEPVTVDDEIKRVIPVIEAVRKKSRIPISIDTYKAETAKQAIDAGADIINDVSALRFDPKMVNVVTSKNVPVILMHMAGMPKDMQQNPHYENCIEEIMEFFEERIEYCLKNNVDKSKLIIDPGIGFGKRLSDNIELLSRLFEFKRFHLPILIGTSRKSFINILNPVDNPPEKRIGGSIASAVTAIINGASIVRAHDIAETVEALKIVWAVKGNL